MTEDTSDYYYSPVQPPKPAMPTMTTAEALKHLNSIDRLNQRTGRLYPLWTYRNDSADVVTVTLHTSSPKYRELTIVWKPGESHAVNAAFGCALHTVRVAGPGAAPVCYGGHAPVQLVRVDPPQDYVVHPSLFRNAAAELAAITPKEATE